MEKPLTIGQAARLTELPVETIRYYQREGLIEEPPKPTTGGYRIYPEATIQRLHLIRRAKQLGFTLSEIHNLLQVDGPKSCAAANEFAREKLQELEQKIRDLYWMRDTLQRIVNQCDNQGCRHDCNIIQTLQNPKIDF